MPKNLLPIIGLALVAAAASLRRTEASVSIAPESLGPRLVIRASPSRPPSNARTVASAVRGRAARGERCASAGRAARWPSRSPASASRSLAATCVRFVTRSVDAGYLASLAAGRTGRRTSSPPQLGQRPRQAVGGAVGAEGALERADQGVRRVRRQVLVAALAVGSERQHVNRGLPDRATNRPQGTEAVGDRRNRAGRCRTRRPLHRSSPGSATGSSCRAARRRRYRRSPSCRPGRRAARRRP